MEDKVELRNSVKNAQLILAYASERGIDVREEIIVSIINVRKKLDLGDDLEETEAKFWMVYSELARLIRPVSIESLEVIRGNRRAEPSRWFVNIFRSKSLSSQYLKTYRWVGIFILVVMLLVQIYWVIGAKLIADFHSLPIELEKVMKEKIEKEKMLGEKAVESFEINLLQSKIWNIEDNLASSSIVIRKWNRIWQMVIPVSSDSTDTEASSESALLEMKYASFALDAIKEYFLPLLYGLLGAFAYIFRNIFQEIKEKTLTSESNIKYVLRLHLGALTGLAVGWFFGDDEGKSVFTISNLSPLALSFLAGYSVEIFFSGMDKIINSFSSEKESEKSEALQGTLEVKAQ